jgi:hypothetical protein
MCTVVVRWSTGRPVLVLALRDERTDRAFDDPAEWWPQAPHVVGGRDRAAGGSWCVTDVASGTSALVLNRTTRRAAAPSAPSRGVLPLLAVRHGADWPQHLDVTGMAGFALVLAAPQRLSVWEFDGTHLTGADRPPGTTMLTAGPTEQGRADRHLPRFAAAASADAWRALVTSSRVEDDPASLLVRHTEGHLVFATVFAQVIEAAPGRVAHSWSRTPSRAQGWTERTWSRP